METIQFSLQGMTCGGCVRSVERVLSTLPGIKESKVEVGRASVTFDPAVQTKAAIHEALSKTGFGVDEETSLQ